MIPNIMSNDPIKNGRVILSPRNTTDNRVAVNGLININTDALGASRRRIAMKNSSDPNACATDQ